MRLSLPEVDRLATTFDRAGVVWRSHLPAASYDRVASDLASQGVRWLALKQANGNYILLSDVPFKEAGPSARLTSREASAMLKAWLVAVHTSDLSTWEG